MANAKGTRLVVKAHVSTRDFAEVGRHAPEVFNNEPKLEIWIDNVVAVDNTADLMEYLRLYFRAELAKKQSPSEEKS